MHLSTEVPRGFWSLPKSVVPDADVCTAVPKVMHVVQVVKEAGLNTATQVLVARGKENGDDVWQVLESRSLHRRSPSPAA